MILLSRFVLAAAVITAVGAAQYNETLCAGVIDFDISADAATQAVLDANVLALYSYLPVWATKSCKRAVKTFACVAVYETTNPMGYCADSCLDTLSICGSLWGLSEDLEVLYAMYSASCTGVEPCLSSDVSSLVASESDDTECPGNLVVPDQRSFDGDGEVLGIKGTGCAISCPTFWFSDAEWQHLHTIAESCLLVGDILAFISCLGLWYKRQYLLMGYTGAVAVGVLMELIVLSVNNASRGHNHLICDGNAGYVAQHPAVVFSSALLVFCTEVGYTCAFLVALRIWLRIAVDVRISSETDKKLGAAFLWMPFVVTIIIAGGNAFGYDYETQPLAPYILFGDKEAYYWVFFAPLFVYVNAQLVLMLHTVFRAQTALFRSASTSRRVSTLDAMKQSVVVNHRMLLFLVFHVLTSVYIFYLSLYYFGVYPDILEEETDDYIDCLLTKGATDAHAARAECGDVPRIPIWAYMSLNMFKATAGVIPFLVFGTNGFAKDQLRRFKSTGSIIGMITGSASGSDRSERHTSSVRKTNASRSPEPSRTSVRTTMSTASTVLPKRLGSVEEEAGEADGQL